MVIADFNEKAVYNTEYSVDLNVSNSVEYSSEWKSDLNVLAPTEITIIDRLKAEVMLGGGNIPNPFLPDQNTDNNSSPIKVNILN